jgi:hypothetical protein
VASTVTVWVLVLSGCGEPSAQEGSAMPPPDFQRKLEEEHPELFRIKVGKKYQEISDRRERRRIIREAWLKEQGKAQ